MRQLDGKPTVPFKGELSNIEIAGIEHILDNIAINQEIGINTLPDSMGLAYTSTNGNLKGMFAMYHVTEEVGYRHLPEDVNDTRASQYYKIEGFCITQNNMLIMVCSKWSDELAYEFFEIETKDFY